MPNRIVVKTGNVKNSYHMPLKVENALTQKKFSAIKEEDLIDLILNLDKLVTKGDECNCVLDGDRLIWVNQDGDKLPFDADDSDFENIEVNEEAYKMWKEKRTQVILSTLSESEEEALKEWFVSLVNKS